MRAMVLAGETLFIAGASVSDLQDYESRKGELWAVSAVDGRKLEQYDLGGAPVFEGMAAAQNKLLVSLRDGRLVCFGK
jgi:hypothetical protein